MERQNDKKNWLIGTLLVAIMIMSVGYAAFASTLVINGSAEITSKWEVVFTGITAGTPVGTATEDTPADYTATTATFDVNLIAPGDSITYTVEVSNNGSIDAKLDSIVESITGNATDPIKYTISGLTEGENLSAGSKKTFTVKVEYDSSVTDQPTDSQLTNDLTLTLNYIQK